MRKRLMMPTLLLIVAMVVSGCAPQGGGEVEPDTVKEIPLALGMMKTDTVEHTYVSVGETIPVSQVDLYIAGGGYIEEIMVEAGDVVEAGLILIRLDGSEMDMTNYNATESQLRTVRDNLGSQLASIKDNYTKQEALFEDGLITSLELEQSRLQLENLEREYANAQSSYRNQLAIIRDGLEDASESRIIESSVSGKVAAVYAEEGQQANGQLGLSIIDDTLLHMRTYVTGEIKKEIAQGEQVRLKSGWNDDGFRIGKIAEIQTLPDTTTKLFEVLVDFEDQAGWNIGDYAEVEFILDRYEALMVPASSVVRKGDDRYIYTYQDEQLSKVPVETGRSKGQWLEVTNLKKASQVVVRGQDQLTSEDSAYIIYD